MQHLQETRGGYSSDSETRHPLISRHCTKPLLFIPLRTLLHSSKTQLLSFQSFPHSLPKTTRVGGTHQSLPHYLLASLSRFPQSPACPDLVGVINRCIIPPREHPAERSRMPGPRLPHREGNHHSRILSAFSERPGQRLQPEIEPRSGHESGRSRRPSGLAFSGRAIPGSLRQRLGQPRHQVRTSPPGSFQLLSSRNRHSLRFVAPWTANSRRTSHSRRAHAYLRRPERRAIQPPAPDEARAAARQRSPAPARHERSALRASLVWRCRGARCKGSRGAAARSGLRRQGRACPSGKGGSRTSAGRRRLSVGGGGPEEAVRRFPKAIRVGEQVELCCVSRPFANYCRRHLSVTFSPIRANTGYSAFASALFIASTCSACRIARQEGPAPGLSRGCSGRETS